MKYCKEASIWILQIPLTFNSLPPYPPPIICYKIKHLQCKCFQKCNHFRSDLNQSGSEIITAAFTLTKGFQPWQHDCVARTRHVNFIFCRRCPTELAIPWVLILPKFSQFCGLPPAEPLYKSHQSQQSRRQSCSFFSYIKKSSEAEHSKQDGTRRGVPPTKSPPKTFANAS